MSDAVTESLLCTRMWGPRDTEGKNKPIPKLRVITGQERQGQSAEEKEEAFGPRSLQARQHIVTLGDNVNHER